MIDRTLLSFLADHENEEVNEDGEEEIKWILTPNLKQSTIADLS
jgi:hypothetical protein